MFTSRKCLRGTSLSELTKHYSYLEVLVPYLNNPSEVAMFGSNKIKEEHETMKLKNEEVRYAQKLKIVINKANRPVHA